MAPVNQQFVISVYRSCPEPGLALVNVKMRGFGLAELSGARPGSGELKMHDFGLPELPGARPGSGEPKLRGFGSPELPGARPWLL